MTEAALAHDGSTFAPALRLLPEAVRADIGCFYDVLRTLDDLVDEKRDEAGERVGAVERWAFGEDVDTYETRRLKALSHRHEFPRSRMLEFCAAMRHDMDGGTIETEEDFELYAQGAGGSVGIMLAALLGGQGAEVEARMAALGRAMQRANILRDIDEDARQGRVYISRATIERFGEPKPGRRAELMRDQIARADALFEEGVGAIPLLPNGQLAMAVAAALYREILRQIEREGFGRQPGRVVVPVWRRRLLIARQKLKRSMGGRPASGVAAT